jgi:N4-gp56 family major capsid protein
VSAGTGQWFDIQKAAMTGGDLGDNPIFWGSIGQYHGVLLHENARVPNAVSNAGAAVANTKRNLFLGAQAMTMAFGRRSGSDTMFVWLEELRDFGRQLGVGISAVWGLKKVAVTPTTGTATPVDFGVIVIDVFGTDIDTLGSAASQAY